MSYSPIAITGIGCRYPGGITSAAKFWHFIQAGNHAVTPIPQGRKDLWATWGYEGSSEAFGGWIDQVEYFDAPFFQISPREARQMDPQQRILLEIAWEALEDAGIPPSALAGTQAGVFTGLFLDEYWDMQRYLDINLIDSQTNTGGTMSIAANRISYAFDLKGPSMSVDTACSSSLTAIHVACRSLNEHECDVAIAGGVNLILGPHTTRGFEEAGMLSPDGFCRAFDAGANGYGRSDGAGLVVLKRLDQAVDDEDSIYAVIHGSAINQDGKTRGLTEPDPSAQTRVVQAAADAAGIHPWDLAYIEAHGTGTPVGDPLEAAAIGEAIRGKSKCMIGSVKTNIGHTEAASGVAGLIKTALILNKGLIPPSLHFNDPNPAIPFDKMNLKVVTEPVPNDDMAFAGVNSFGFGGANAHVILGKAPIPEKHALPSSSCLLAISATTQTALEERIQQVFRHIQSGDTSDLYALSATLGVRRDHHLYRMGLVVNDCASAEKELQTFVNGDYPDEMVLGSPHTIAPVVFIFTGMGPQWPGMGKTLYQIEPTYREAIDHCDALYREYAQVSIRDEMMKADSDSRMSDPEVSQPANLMLQWALTRLWASWGIKPEIVIGHSVGEIAAAAVAGAITLDEALRIIYHRSRLQQQCQGKGAMLAVGLSEDEATDLLKPHGERLSIAALNSPVSITISGDISAIEKLEKEIEARETFCKRLPVNVAYHSRQMDVHREEFLHAVDDLNPGTTSIPMISTVTGEVIDGTTLSADYWWANIREPIRFEAACSNLPDNKNLLLIQIGPHPVLNPSIYENLAHAGRSGLSLASLKRNTPDLETLLHSLAHCYVQGHHLSWRKLFRHSFETEKLPSYPWQREKFWPEIIPRRQKKAVGSGGIFLSTGLTTAIGPRMKIWEAEIDLEIYPFLRDHRMQDKILFPLAGVISLLLETGNEEYSAFKKLAINNPLILSEGRTYPIQVTETASAFTISRQSGPLNGEGSIWETVAVAQHDVANSTVLKFSVPTSPLKQQYSGAEFYDLIANRGYEYGAHFRWIQFLRIYNNVVQARIVTPESLEQGHYFHPVLIDNAIQAMIPLLPDTAFFLPVSVDRIWHHNSGLSETLYDIEGTISDVSEHALRGDVALYNSRGELILEMCGIQFKKAGWTDKGGQDQEDHDSLFSELWHPIIIQTDQPVGTDNNWLIIDKDGRAWDHLKARLDNDFDFVEILPGTEAEELVSATGRLLDNESAQGHTSGQNVIIIMPGDIDQKINPPDTGQAGYILRLIQSILNSDTQKVRLWIITSGSQSIQSEDIPNLSHAAVAGLGRTLASEHPELGVTLIDLSSSPDEEEIDTLAALLSQSGIEREYAIRNSQVYVRRLGPVRWSQFAPANLSTEGFENPNYRLSTSSPEAIENIQFYASPMPSISADEVLLRVRMTGLNFRDVMTSLGILPGFKADGQTLLGWECVGEVVAVGTAVNRVIPGELVIAIVPGCAGKYVAVNEVLIAPKPANLSLSESVALPIAFSTAFHALVNLGGLEPGKRVLIHSATGGVGLAAVQLAKLYGAEIFATAGSEKKREYLKKLDIPHISDSRSTDFADYFMTATDNAGIDIVLNSLSGDGLRAGLSVLAPYGQFIEIGKTDILGHQPIDLSLLEENISYHVVDLAKMTIDHPEKTNALLREVAGMASEGRIDPPTVDCKPIQEAHQQFRMMAQARHIGKLALEINDDPVNLRLRAEDAVIKPKATYIITGGLGGIGRVITKWLLEKGAQSIILCGRSEIDGSALESLEMDTGRTVRYVQVDVSDEAALRNALEKIKVSCPPVRGIFHCAGILDDGLLMNYDESRLKAVMASKAVGAWHLHQLTLEIPLDYFILFSSVASTVGTAGQGGYAAANASLDALAALRQKKILPVLTINWGPWADTGMTKDPLVSDRMGRLGFHPIRPEEACRILDRLLHLDVHQTCVMPLQGEEPRIKRDNPLFGEITDAINRSDRIASNPDGLSDFNRISKSEQEHRVFRLVSDAVSRIIEIDTARIDRNQSWRSLGIDSLMAVEIRHLVEKKMNVILSTADLQSSKSIAGTIDDIVRQLRKSTA